MTTKHFRTAAKTSRANCYDNLGTEAFKPLRYLIFLDLCFFFANRLRDALHDGFFLPKSDNTCAVCHGHLYYLTVFFFLSWSHVPNSYCTTLSSKCQLDWLGQTRCGPTGLTSTVNGTTDQQITIDLGETLGAKSKSRKKQKKTKQKEGLAIQMLR